MRCKQHDATETKVQGFGFRVQVVSQPTKQPWPSQPFLQQGADALLACVLYKLFCCCCCRTVRTLTLVMAHALLAPAASTDTPTEMAA